MNRRRSLTVRPGEGLDPRNRKRKIVRLSARDARERNPIGESVLGKILVRYMGRYWPWLIAVVVLQFLSALASL